MTPNVVERITRLEERVGVVEEGVSNVLDLQKEVREFFVEFRIKEQTRKEELERQQREVKEALEAKDRLDDRRNSRIMRWIAFGSLMAAIGAGLIAYVALRQGDKKVENNPQSIQHSALQSPQDAKGWNP